MTDAPVTNATLLAALQQIQTNWNANLAQFTTWQTGTVTGGAAAADGSGSGGPFYPLTDMSGNVYYFRGLQYYLQLVSSSFNAASLINALGYTPANKAGETFSGFIGVGVAPAAPCDVVTNASASASLRVRLSSPTGSGRIQFTDVPAAAELAGITVTNAGILGISAVGGILINGYYPVTTLGGQTIAGGLSIGSSGVGSVSLLAGSTGNSGYAAVYDSSGARVGYFGYAGATFLNVNADGGRAIGISASALSPQADAGVPLGSASYRWSVLYSASGAINTSDARQKTLRGTDGAFTDAELDAWADVRAGVVFQYNDAIAEKTADKARLHAGYTAQHVQDTFSAHGLDPSRYALWCSDALKTTVTKSETRQRQTQETVDEPYTEVTEQNGNAVQTTGTRSVTRPAFKTLPLVDDKGAPILVTLKPAVPAVLAPDSDKVLIPAQDAVITAATAQVPVMEDYTHTWTEEEDAGETRLGLRYSQCAVWEAAWARRELARVEARLAALEAAKAS